jgi:hypothetical protein
MRRVSLIAKRCEASMPPVNAHRNTISFRKIGASLGREAKQGAEVAWFWGVGANQMGLNLAIGSKAMLVSAH